MTCRFCGNKEFNYTEKIFKNGTKHIQQDCSACGKFNGYKRQNMDPNDFVMPYGKYKGHKLGDIVLRDRLYFNWMLENTESVAIVDRLVEVLDCLESSQKYGN